MTLRVPKSLLARLLQSFPSVCSTACHFCCFWQSCHALHPQDPLPPNLSLFPWAATNRQLSSPAAGWEQLGRRCAAAGTAVHSWWGTPPSSPCQLSGGTQLPPDNTSAGRWELSLPLPLLSVGETLGFCSAAPLSHQTQLDLFLKNRSSKSTSPPPCLVSLSMASKLSPGQELPKECAPGARLASLLLGCCAHWTGIMLVCNL